MKSNSNDLPVKFKLRVLDVFHALEGGFEKINKVPQTEERRPKVCLLFLAVEWKLLFTC
jgi:hypothetical protein